MAKYIDADALLENLKKQYGEDLGWQCTVNMSDVGMMIEDASTADVVEVVRCKDCKHATFYRCKNDPCYNSINCEYRIGIGDEDFFCSCGERRTDNDV